MRIDRSLSIFIIVLLFLLTKGVLPTITLLNKVIASEQPALSTIQMQKEVLIVGSEQDYPPFAIGMTDATASGFTVDLWKTVAAEVGLNFKIKVGPFHEILHEFKDGKIDVLINLAQSEARHQFADFTVPHVIIHGAIFVRKGNVQIHSENDLIGKSIIVVKADIAHEYAISNGWEKQLVFVETAEQGMRILASGKYDAMLLGKLTGMKSLRDLNITNIVALDINTGFTQKFSFAVHKGNADLLAKINEGLALTQPSGKFDKLYEKWFGPYEEKQITFWDVFLYVAPIALIFIGYSSYEFFKHRIIQKRTATQLAFSARIFKEAREAIMITDAKANIIDVNPSFCEITGYKKDEVIGQNPRILNSGKHRPEYFSEMWADLSNQGYWQNELWNCKKNGELYCVLTTIITLCDEDGKVIHYVGFFLDITERKRIELELADKERHLSTLISTTPVGVFETDQDGKYTFVNARWSEITGLPFEVARAEGWVMALHPEDKEKVHVEWLASVAENRPFYLEYRFQNADGKVFWVIGQSCESRSINGELLGYIGTITDITERKRVEESLLMMRFSVDHADDSIFWIDRDGHILYANQAACEERGYSSAEMLVMRIFDLDPDYPPAVWGAHFEDLKQRGNITLKTEHRTKEGLIYPIEVNANYVHIGGHEFNFCFSRNITDRILLEDELKTREKKFRSIIDISPVPMALNDYQLNITYLNPAFIQTFGYSLEDIPTLADWWSKAYPNPDYRDWVKVIWQSTLAQAKREYTPFPPLELNICTKSGEFKTVVISVAIISESNEHLVVLFDITERKKADDYEQFRSNILEQLVTNKPLYNILEALVQGVEQINPEMICSILLLDDKGKHFIKSIGPSLPDFYNEAIKGLEIGIGVGSCGSAAFISKPVIVEDIATHPYWTPFKDLAAKANLSACWSQPIFSSNNQVLGIFAIYHHQLSTPDAADIYLIEQSARLASLAIERKQNEMELRIAATAFDSQEGMIVTDANNIILRVNSAFTTITGYTAEEVVGKSPRILQSGQHDAAFYTTMWESINTTGTWQGEVWNQRKNGEVFAEHLIITAVKDQNNLISNYVATLTDITLRKEAVNKIEQLAFYDPLTGLPNRRLLLDRLKLAFAASQRSGRQGALLFIDLDNFKILNDTFGHNEGDLLLQQVAQRLELCIRECDTVARLGGDEFVVMLEDLREQAIDAALQAEIIGHKIMDILNQPYLLGTHEYHSTPSIGVALFNGQEQSSEELLKQADIAMYQAKTSGRNALRFFNQKMQASINARVSLEEDLRQGLKENQFILYYQPQVHQGGQIIGAEVLIRWQHPLRGMVSPAEFIPLAEETHLILPIGEWVLKTACAQLKIWQGNEHTRDLNLAVNISARQFHQTDFVVQVSQILKFNAINPRRLKLELTESLVLTDIDDTILKMNALRKIGVRFSMDDFGTGYSSLSSLKKLPLDQLKIDQSFVRDIAINLDNTIIVETIIAMANKLNMECIAEGVETEAQRLFLEQHNCLLYQGYLFSRPLPIEQFELFMNKNSLFKSSYKKTL